MAGSPRAPWPRLAAAGSPGMRWVRMNATSVTPITRITPIPRRRPKNRPSPAGVTRRALALFVRCAVTAAN